MNKREYEIRRKESYFWGEDSIGAFHRVCACVCMVCVFSVCVREKGKLKSKEYGERGILFRG